MPDLRRLLGRSILLTKGNERACATLVKQSASYTTAHVRLQNTISGDVWFRQAEGQDWSEIVADVFDASAATSTSYNWNIYTGTGTNCSQMTETFNPTPSSTGSSCTVDTKGSCQVGDLTGKHDQLQIGQTKGSSRKLYQDSNLALSGSKSVLGQYLVILDATNKVLSCGKITELKEKQAQAMVNKDGVRGTVKFVQKSPFDVTSIYVTLAGMHLAAGGYHVHEYPVPSQLQASDQLCSADSVGGHWNPFNKPFPSTTGVTTDQFEIGDISGKFGSLNGHNNSFQTYQDHNMPLFGQYSIVGRCLVIHKNADQSPRWVCTNIDDLEARTVAIANFKCSVIGTVIFSQSIDDPTSDTWIYGELNYADGTANPTTQHMWMIHQNMVGNGGSGSGGACSVGGMYNPFKANNGGDYATQCKASNPLRCQVGDGTKLTEPLAIRTNEKLAKKFFFTTSNMPLSGMGSIIGKSAVIHAANSGSAILSCTNVYHLRIREAIVDSWSNDVRGYFKFSQKYSHINEPTVVAINVAGMNSIAGKYHVHEFPIPKNSPNPCSGASVADRYNPYNFDPKTSPAPEHGTYDKYEAGDLSGKNGLFENKTNYTGSYSDNLLNLFGPRSVVGRSVVIHKMSDGSRWSCGNIRENVMVTVGRLLKAKAEFMDSDVKGHVFMEQYVYPDGSMSDTTVYVYINYTDGREKTMGHKITIGSMPAWGDRKSTSNRCASTAAIFNPFSVNTQTGYDECSMANPLRCSAGDMSGKLGTYSIGGGKMFVTDVNLPLAGKHSVIGRSIVIGAANGGSGKMACVNIEPEGALSTDVILYSKSGNMLYNMANTYSTALGTDISNVAVFKEKDGGCGTFEVYFMGPNADDLRSRFDTLKREKKLGEYEPTICGADKTKMSVLFVAIVYLCKKVLL